MKKRIIIITLLIVLAVMLVIFSNNLKTGEKKVVIYVAHDQDYSEPILKDFEKITGIKVEALYDTEATKTVGLVNRIIAEKANPRADIFWNNEAMRTIKLKKEGILEPYCSPNAHDIDNIYKDENCYWTGFAARARVIVYNTEKMSEPTSIYDLANPEWKGKTCIANPLFGSTGTHVAAIFALLGDDEAKQFFLDLKENGIKILGSNSMTVDQTIVGECYFALTDTDDAYVAIRAGKPVQMVFADQGANQIGTLVFPNSIMMIKGAPNPEEAKVLIDYLLSTEVEEKLAESALQIPLKKSSTVPEHVPDSKNIKPMDITTEEMYEKIDVSTLFVQDVFLR